MGLPLLGEKDSPDGNCDAWNVKNESPSSPGRGCEECVGMARTQFKNSPAYLPIPNCWAFW